MNKKKIISIIVILLVLCGIGGVIYYTLTKQDKNTLTILEKQWIEENKNNMIDLGMVNGVPVFNYDGEGLLFDFIKDIEINTGLEFNKISYTVGNEVLAPYAFTYVDAVQKSDILIYQDNYVIMTKEETKYNQLSELPVLTLGVLESDLESANYYLKENQNLTFKTYKNAIALLEEIHRDGTSIGGIVLPKTTYMKELGGKSSLHIAYQLTEMHQNLVLRLGDNKKLNTIIKKYYQKWHRENYQTVFNNYFSSNYFTFNDIYEEDVANFRAKRYQYGFVNHAPYDALVDGRLVGVNNEIMKAFSKLANIEIGYKEYSSTSKMLEEFNANKLDFFMNSSTQTKYSMDVVSTVSVFRENALILSHNQNNITVNSLSSLKGKTVSVIADSKIESMLKEANVQIKSYYNVKSMMSNVDKESIIALDQMVNEVYLHSTLKNYKIDYRFHVNQEYNHVVRDVKDNQVFAKYFNFYLSFIDEQQYHNLISYNLFTEKIRNTLEIVIVIVFGIFVIACGSFFLWQKNHKKTKKKVNTMSKENKLKYIDMLTSLKNRNYLNDNIQKWDDSEIYPQTIVIVDLNNVAYINDNYGHEEGDNVIREAANILIKNQVPNSEIMRTNGNEFLIYMVEYEEKQVISYIRKLSKEFKELAHGFGAALGYSMIQDAIKTVDDAINEATLDMRNNKEEANN